GKSSPTPHGVGERGRRRGGYSGPRCSCRRRPGGWSGERRSHRPGEPVRPGPCRRASGYRTEACPCARRSGPCRSCSTTGGVVACHSGRTPSSCPDRVGHGQGKRDSDSRSGSDHRPSQSSQKRKNKQGLSLQVIVGQGLHLFNTPETPPDILETILEMVLETIRGFFRLCSALTYGAATDDE